jgi:MFS family permease
LVGCALNFLNWSVLYDCFWRLFDQKVQNHECLCPRSDKVRCVGAVLNENVCKNEHRSERIFSGRFERKHDIGKKDCHAMCAGDNSLRWGFFLLFLFCCALCALVFCLLVFPFCPRNAPCRLCAALSCGPRGARFTFKHRFDGFCSKLSKKSKAPWWSLSTAADFFAVSLPLMRAEFWFGASYAVAISIALPFNLTLSAGRLWLVGVLSSILMLLGMIYFVVLPFVAISVTLSFWIALITCGVANFASAMLLNACYGIFAPLHVRNSLVMQVSGVVCALLMGLLRVILLYSSITVLYSGVLFFAFAMLLIAVAFVCFVILRSRHSKSTHLYSPLVVSMSDSDISEVNLKFQKTRMIIHSPHH